MRSLLSMAASRIRGDCSARLHADIETVVDYGHLHRLRINARFVDAKERAVTPPAEDIAVRGMRAHPALAPLQLRDLRRTCIVQLGRLGLSDAQVAALSGHRLETTKRILETYMPRDTQMAGSAIVARIGDARSGGRWNSNVEDVGTIAPKVS